MLIVGSNGSVFLFFSLPKGSTLSFRTEIQAVAEQRKHEIARFLESLFTNNVSISQSDLVYTFFHPLLRDQQEADIHLRKLRGKKLFLSNFTHCQLCPGCEDKSAFWVKW